jgi:hypothetical protein
MMRFCVLHNHITLALCLRQRPACLGRQRCAVSKVRVWDEVFEISGLQKVTRAQSSAREGGIKS